jgi:Tfp pilus assembly protein PilF
MSKKINLLTTIMLLFFVALFTACSEKEQNESNDSAQKSFNRGSAYYKLGNIDSAIKEFENTIMYDRKHKQAHYNLAVLYKEKGRFTEAIHEFEEYLKYSSEEEDKVVRERAIKEMEELKQKN